MEVEGLAVTRKMAIADNTVAIVSAPILMSDLPCFTLPPL
jgi:hypothetical protein